MAWAFATVKQIHEKLFTAVAKAAEQQLSEFTAQGVANRLWAFATVKHQDAKLFKILAREIFAMLCYVFAMFCYVLLFQDAKLFKILARAAEQRLRELNAQDVLLCFRLLPMFPHVFGMFSYGFLCFC